MMDKGRDLTFKNVQGLKWISQMLQPHGLASAPQLPKLDSFSSHWLYIQYFSFYFIGKSTLEGCLCRCWKWLSSTQPRAKRHKFLSYKLKLAVEYEIQAPAGRDIGRKRKSCSI
jgi:hypothetical protein